MKKTVVFALTSIMCVGACFARGGHGGPVGHGGFHRAPPPMHHHHHPHGGSFWGRGGSNFWPGFVGGMVGGAIVNRPIVTTPVVTTPVITTPVVTTPIITTPVVTTQNVWIEGRYIDQVQPNGTVIRVWQPGHYEQRQVAY